MVNKRAYDLPEHRRSNFSQSFLCSLVSVPMAHLYKGVHIGNIVANYITHWKAIGRREIYKGERQMIHHPTPKDEKWMVTLSSPRPTNLSKQVWYRDDGWTYQVSMCYMDTELNSNSNRHYEIYHRDRI